MYSHHTTTSNTHQHQQQQHDNDNDYNNIGQHRIEDKNNTVKTTKNKHEQDNRVAKQWNKKSRKRSTTGGGGLLSLRYHVTWKAPKDTILFDNQPISESVDEPKPNLQRSEDAIDGDDKGDEARASQNVRKASKNR